MKVVGAHKAGAVLHTHCHGREGHSSAPEKGANAVMMAGQFVRLLETVWDELRADADPRFDPPHSTVQANMIEGGSASNILARDARVTWEYRALPDRDAAAIVAKVRERAEYEILAKYRKRAPEARLETVLHAAYPGLVMDDASPAVRLALTLTGANHAEAVSYGTEAGHFQGAGIPAVIVSMKHAIGEMGVMRSAKTLLKLNQKGGYDCSSCAWPDPDGDRNTAEFCENGAKAIADEATLSRATPEFFAEHSVVDLSQKSDYWLGKRGRITHPMVLRHGATHYVPITWTAVFEMIAKELNALSSPDEAIFYTSGRASNEAAFLYQLFVRQFGTNNLPDCSNMCHESSGSALTETIGVGKGTVKLEDVENAGVIFIIGQNPGTNHPRMLTALEKAKDRGCKIISANPLPEAGLLRFKNPQNIRGVIGAGTTLSDFFLQVRINGDVALLKGIMKQLLEDEDHRPGQVLDHKFIDEKTAGFVQFMKDLRATDWNAIVEGSGISREQIRDVAEVIASTEPSPSTPARRSSGESEARAPALGAAISPTSTRSRGLAETK